MRHHSCDKAEEASTPHPHVFPAEVWEELVIDMYQPQAPQLTAYQYNVQAVEDHELLHEAVEAGKQPPPPPRAGSYRPTPLRWPFIICEILLLCCALGLIVYALLSMPGSDSTAHIQQARSIVMRRSEANSSSSAGPSVSSPTLSSSVASPVQSSVGFSTQTTASLPTTAGLRSTANVDNGNLETSTA